MEGLREVTGKPEVGDRRGRSGGKVGVGVSRSKFWVGSSGDRGKSIGV